MWRPPRRRVPIGVLGAVALANLVTSGCGSEGTGPPGASTDGSLAPAAEPAEAAPVDGELPAEAAPADGGRPSEAAPAGGYPMGILELTVVDRSRPTDEVVTAGEVVVPAAESRTIPVRVVYPAVRAGSGSEPAGSEFPLVVFAHGLGGTADGLPDFFEALVQAGYVVAAPDFPETTAPARNPFDYEDQPADVSFVLDELVDREADPDDEIADLFDPTRLAVGGHSLGGLTTYGVAFHDCCRDERFDAALIYAAAYFSRPGEAVFAPGGEPEWSDLPSLFVTGTSDPTPGVDLMPEFFEQMQGPAYLLTLIGEEHPAGLYGAERYRPPTYRTTIAFLDAYLKDDPTALDAIQPVDDLYDWRVRSPA